METHIRTSNAGAQLIADLPVTKYDHRTLQDYDEASVQSPGTPLSTVTSKLHRRLRFREYNSPAEPVFMGCSYTQPSKTRSFVKPDLFGKE